MGRGGVGKVPAGRRSYGRRRCGPRGWGWGRGRGCQEPVRAFVGKHERDGFVCREEERKEALRTAHSIVAAGLRARGEGEGESERARSGSRLGEKRSGSRPGRQEGRQAGRPPANRPTTSHSARQPASHKKLRSRALVLVSCSSTTPEPATASQPASLPRVASRGVFCCLQFTTILSPFAFLSRRL